jgi:hypothetical protein
MKKTRARGVGPLRVGQRSVRWCGKVVVADDGVPESADLSDRIRSPVGCAMRGVGQQ